MFVSRASTYGCISRGTAVNVRYAFHTRATLLPSDDLTAAALMGVVRTVHRRRNQLFSSTRNSRQRRKVRFPSTL